MIACCVTSGSAMSYPCRQVRAIVWRMMKNGVFAEHGRPDAAFKRAYCCTMDPAVELAKLGVLPEHFWPPMSRKRDS
jgi:hypothetical protein